MSYELYIDGRPVGQMASIFGLADLREKYGDRDDELGRFLRNGFTKARGLGDLEGVIKEALDSEGDDDLKATLSGILRKLPEGKTVSFSNE